MTVSIRTLARAVNPKGYTGSQGGTGYIGSQGNLGYTGSQGAGYTGSQGAVGDPGYTGSQGAGYTGSQGAGYTGSQGAVGGTGYTGSQGAGYTGSQGAVGGTGYTGSQGVGYTGSQGVTDAGNLTGATLAANVLASSLTSVGSLAALTMGGTVSMADNVIGRPRFTDYAETYTTPAISSGTLTLNIENGNVFRASLNANITTLTISNPSGTGNACSFTLIFDADGTARTVTWPAAVKWPGGTAPTLTSTASRSDMFVFYTNTAGTTWYAMTAAQNFVTS